MPASLLPFQQILSWPADNWSAVGSLLTAAIAIAAAVVASIQVREARQLRLQQAQPYVAVYLEPDPVSTAFVDLVIKNFGTTAAYDVEVTFDPPLRRTSESPGGEEVAVPDKFRTLVPGQEWKTFFDVGHDRVHSGLPKLYEVKVRLKEYRGKRAVPLDFEYALDLAPFECRMWTEIYGTHHIAKALREIQKHMKGWSESGSSGLSVVSRNGDQKDSSRRQRIEEMRQARSASASDGATSTGGEEASASE